MAEILITGGAGFIGVNLVRALAAGNAKIRVLDNLSAGRAEDLKGLPVDLMVGDICDAKTVAKAMSDIKVVVHLAADTGVVESVADPERNLAINVIGTINLLQAAVRNKVERFIFASTGGAILGEVTPPVHEDMVPCPISPYGASKMAGEGYCAAFWGSYGLKTVALRFSNVYGPFSYHKGSVIAKFFRQIMAGKEMTVYGDGSQTRDFVYVQDICRAIVAALKADLPYGKPIQLGTGRETSINRLVELMGQVVGEGQFPPVRYAPTRPGEVQRNYGSIDRARKCLGFSPTTDLLTGLTETWMWFQQGATTKK
jgi:UDP-glucose 4-epimerase